MSANVTTITLVAAVCVFMPNFLYLARRLFTTMASSGEFFYTPGTHSVAYVTAPSEEVAKMLAEGLVQKRLAACVNIIPSILSVYEWENKIQKDNEVLMMIKTRTSRVEELTQFVRENHPYEVCEVISTPIQQGNPPYLKWLGEIVAEKSQS